MGENTLELRERSTEQSEVAAPRFEASPAPNPTPATTEQSEATAPRLETSPAPNPTPATDDGVEERAMWEAVRFARRDLALTTACMLWWGYLVFGEFVLAGVPEWLGWLVVATLGGASYLTLERRVAAYLPERSPRERLRSWLLAILVCGVILLASLMLGMVLPEPVTTLLLLGLVGIGSWWKSRRRRRLLVAIPSESSSLIAIRAVLVGVMTLGAVVMLAHRVSGS